MLNGPEGQLLVEAQEIGNQVESEARRLLQQMPAELLSAIVGNRGRIEHLSAPAN